jgi:type 2 lantibiotic biosynthesis protein LanM
LTERLATRPADPRGREQDPAAAERAQRRWQRWRDQGPFASDADFAQRLDQAGLTASDFRDLLGEPIEAVRQRSPAPPAWLTALAQAFARSPATEPLPLPKPLQGQETARFLDLIAPLLHHGRRRLQEGIAALTPRGPDGPFDPATAGDLLYALLPGHLLTALTGTLALELNVTRLQGLLTGETPAERFQSFLARIRQRETALALLQEYPVLARQLLGMINRWVACSLEFLQRLSADWEALCATFSPDHEVGPLIQVEGGLGDAHRGGRSVWIVRFRSGLRLVYKPRSLAVDVHVQELLAWLNDRGDHPPFRTLKILARENYGWVEFVEPASCTSADEVRRFYQRQGGYLALLYALEATDFHFENLIAAGEHPVLIDVEAFFHPRLFQGAATQPHGLAGELLASSVLRVGLLPQRLFAGEESEGIDLSGLGAVAGQLSPKPVPYWEGAGTDTLRRAHKRMPMAGGRHRPSLQGADVDASAYRAEILSGFRQVYRLLQNERDALLKTDGPVARFARDEVRVILRPTRTYARLLSESFHPDLLRDALERHRFLDWLWAEAKRRPELVPVIRAEQQALQRGDIPLFTTRPMSRDLWSTADERIAGALGETGMTLVERRLRHLSEEDLGRQQWIIEAALAAGAVSAARAPEPVFQVAGPQTPADPERLLAAACAVGNRLEALALRDGLEVAWLGLKTDLKQRQWSLVPAGLDLYEGLPGITLFLAYLGALSGAGRYTELARVALATLRQQLAKSSSSRTSIGAFSGWGGVLYTYAHLAALWQEHELGAEIEAVVERLPDLIEQDESLDVISGSAGCIGSLLQLAPGEPSPRALAVAVQCGDRLLARARTMPRGLAWSTALAPEQPLTGFSHGTAGMAWALLELAARTGAARFRTAALDAIAYERGLFSPAVGNWPDLRSHVVQANNSQPGYATLWCHGAPGIGLARLRTLRYLDDAPTRAEIATALQTTLATGFGYNHSLCHGDLGNLELLVQAGETLSESRWRPTVDRLAALILAHVQSHNWRCGTPQQTESPGLMTGLAGIGYGLLRLAAPARVPAVLVLAPPPAAW